MDTETHVLSTQVTCCTAQSTLQGDVHVPIHSLCPLQNVLKTTPLSAIPLNLRLCAYSGLQGGRQLLDWTGNNVHECVDDCNMLSYVEWLLTDI